MYTHRDMYIRVCIHRCKYTHFKKLFSASFLRLLKFKCLIKWTLPSPTTPQILPMYLITWVIHCVEH